MIRIPYTPRVYQVPIHEDTARFKCVVAHRRAGKTVALVNHLLRAALQVSGHRGQFAYVGPTYRMSKRIAWDYVRQYSAPIPGCKLNSSELRLELPNGARLMLLGADSIHDLRGIYLDGAVLDEYALMSPRVFPEVILPALMDYGGWAVLAGTPLGANQLKRAYENAASGAEGWRAYMLKASQTGAIKPADLDLARANMSDDEYAQEFECSFAAVIKGAYYGETIGQLEAQGRICDVAFDPALAVTAACDLGMRDAFAVWFLQEHYAGGQVRAIDYREYHGKGIPQVVAEVRKLPFPVTRWVFPHDLSVKELGTGRSRIEIAREHIEQLDIASLLPIADGIAAVRAVLPMMVFDRARCQFGLDALRQYRAEWDEEKGVQMQAPLHDWSSHCADALRTYATARSGALRTNWRESLRDIGARDVGQSRMRRVASR